MIGGLNKKPLLFILAGVVFLILVAAFIYFLSTDQDAAHPSTKPTVMVTDERWNTIVFPTDGVSIRVPREWETYLYETLKAGIISRHSQDQTTIELYLYYTRDTHEENIKKYKDSQEYFLIYKRDGGERIAEYTGRIPVGSFLQLGDGDLTNDNLTAAQGLRENSYVKGLIAPFQDRSLIAHCQVYGPRYAEFISDCNEFVDSLSLVK